MSVPSGLLRARTLAVSVMFAAFVPTSDFVRAEEPQIDWKTLPEYMEMDRDAQRELILHTRRIVMRQLAETDFDRAECVSRLFDVDTKEGQSQYYDTKGLLKAAAEKELDWKAQQIVAHTITKDFCPAPSEDQAQASK